MYDLAIVGGGPAGVAAAVYAARKRLKTVLITECSMSDNVAAEYPELEFVRPCNLCPFMKKIELSNILHALENETTEVHIDPAIAARAKVSVERMNTGWKYGT